MGNRLRWTEDAYAAFLRDQRRGFTTSLHQDAYGPGRGASPVSGLPEGAFLAQVKALAKRAGFLVYHTHTWIPRGQLSLLDRHLWFLTKVQDLLAQHHAAVLAYEDFMAVPHPEDALRDDVDQWRLMHRLIGGLQALALSPPHPVLMPLAPGRWEALVTACAHPSRSRVAVAINQRLGTRFVYDRYSNHAIDAVGVALGALTLMQATPSPIRRSGQAACVPRRRA